jgi:hypothetical protein
MDLEMDMGAIFPLLGLTILNSLIILTSCGSKLSDELLQQTVVEEQTQNAQRVPSTSNHTTRKTSLTHQLAKKTSQKTLKILASGRGCSAVCVLQHITPNCAAEDQMTLNWKTRM